MSSSKVDVLRADIFQILESLIVLEWQEIKNDIRVYTTLDILEALSTMERVLVSRLSDCLDEWKGDDKKQYRSLFQSIEREVKDTITRVFLNPKQKTLRFVHTFNTLLVNRFVELLRLIGAQGAVDMVPLMVGELVAYVSDLEESQQQDVPSAQKRLNSLRASQQENKVLTKNQRLDIIRQAAEEYKEPEA